MICACQSTSDHARYYYDRGISVCSRWKDSFMSFCSDMGHPPSPSHVLGRLDKDGNFDPGNCRWLTPKEASDNRSSSRMVVYKGDTASVAEWARRIGITAEGLRLRLLKHSIEDALTAPVNQQGTYLRTKTVKTDEH